MKPLPEYPLGWDEARIRRILHYYERQNKKYISIQEDMTLEEADAAEPTKCHENGSAVLDER